MGLRVSFLAFVCWLAGCAAAPGAAPAGPGAPAGDFHAIAISDAGGHAVPLGSALGGRPALVSFWAPWCEPCVKELPELDRLARAVAPCGGAVLGVAVGEPHASAAAFARARRATFPQFADEEFHLADALGQRRIPALVVFDAGQRIVFQGDALGGKAVDALEGALAREAAAHGQAPCTAR